jgi:predicted ATPase
MITCLELFNFKSYKGIHKIEFSSFTSVIGPNGSGKCECKMVVVVVVLEVVLVVVLVEERD